MMPTAMADFESLLNRWQSAGVLDAEDAARIRAYESEQTRPAGLHWQRWVIPVSTHSTGFCRATRRWGSCISRPASFGWARKTANTVMKRPNTK